MHVRQARRTATSTKSKTSDANAVDATPNDIDTFGDEVRVHLCPCEARPDFDGLLFLVDDDIVETDHRDLDTMG